jgi:hypothetical protein
VMLIIVSPLCYFPSQFGPPTSQGRGLLSETPDVFRFGIVSGLC